MHNILSKYARVISDCGWIYLWSDEVKLGKIENSNSSKLTTVHR